MNSTRIAPYDKGHLDGILELCSAEDWPSLPSDPERAHVALSAAGSVTVVALNDDHDVVGFAFAFVDAGRIDAYLSMIAVSSAHRRGGIGRALIEAVLAHSGAARLDLLAEPGSEAFYASLPHREFRGFRVYPTT